MTTETELRKLRQNLDEQYKKDRETIDRMIDLIVRSNRDVAPVRVAEDNQRAMTINERVASYISQMDGNFTMQDAWKYIKLKDPTFAEALNRQSMSTAIWKMNKNGNIKVIIPKKGKSGAIYSKI